MFGDLIINWMDHQRSRFMADWNNVKGLVDFNSHPRENVQEGFSAFKYHFANTTMR